MDKAKVMEAGKFWVAMCTPVADRIPYIYVVPFYQFVFPIVYKLNHA